MSKSAWKMVGLAVMIMSVFVMLFSGCVPEDLPGFAPALVAWLGFCSTNCNYCNVSVTPCVPCVPSGPMPAAAGKTPMPKYRVAVMRGGKKVWLPWMVGMRDSCRGRV